MISIFWLAINWCITADLAVGIVLILWPEHPGFAMWVVGLSISYMLTSWRLLTRTARARDESESVLQRVVVS